MRAYQENWLAADARGYGPTWILSFGLAVAVVPVLLFFKETPWLILLPLAIGSAFFLSFEYCRVFSPPFDIFWIDRQREILLEETQFLLQQTNQLNEQWAKIKRAREV